MNHSKPLANNLGIILVTYKPDSHTLKSNLESLKKYYVCVVDNASDDKIQRYLQTFQKKNLIHKLILNNENKGIAHALNQGLLKLPNKIKYVLLLDQDTVIELNLISTHLHDFDKLPDPKKLACGWAFVNKIHPKPYFIKYGYFSRKYFAKTGIHAVDTVITSGMLIDRQKINNVGLFNENLFMDFVDTEWCMRAKSKGFTVYGNFDVQAPAHPIGGEPLSILGFKFPLHSPERHYYMAHNWVKILFLSGLGLKFKFHESLQMLFKFLIYSIFPRQRWQSCKSMIQGVIMSLLKNK